MVQGSLGQKARPAIEGTRKMRISTSASAVMADLKAYIMEDLDPRAMQPAKAYRSEEIQKDAQGRPLYRVPGLYLKERMGQSWREASGVSVKLVKPPAAPIGEMTRVTLTGSVVVTPYVTQGGRQGYSIIADSLEPVKEDVK